MNPEIILTTTEEYKEDYIYAGKEEGKEAYKEEDIHMR